MAIFVTRRPSRPFCSVSYNRFSHHCTRPHHQKAYEDAQNNVQQTDRELTVLYRSQSLVLKGRKSCVSADETDGDEITEGGAQMSFLGEYGHDQTDEERTGNIDEKRAIRKACPHPLSHIHSQPKAGDRAREPTDTHSELLSHAFDLSMPVSSHSRFQNFPNPLASMTAAELRRPRCVLPAQTAGASA